MIIIEYIQLVFVVCGTLTIIAVLLTMAGKQFRKFQLYAEVYRHLKLYKDRRRHRRPIGDMVSTADISREEAAALLSRINITDMITDDFLKEVVNALLQRFYLPENNK